MSVFKPTAEEMQQKTAKRAFNKKQDAAKENAKAHKEEMLKRQAEELKTVSERVPGVQKEYEEARRRAYEDPDNPELIENFKSATEKLNQANKAVTDLKASHAQERNVFNQRAKQATKSAQDDWDGKSAPAGPDYDEAGDDEAGDDEAGDVAEPSEPGADQKSGIASKMREKSNKLLDKVEKDASKLKPELSATFYRDVGAAITGRPGGNVLDAEAATAKAVSKDEQNEAAHRNMEAQQQQQIANRNEYTEAGKIASMQNDAQNRQNIANKEGLSGAAAALQRTTNAPDVQSQQTRQDTARTNAAQRREKGDQAQEDATSDAGLAEEFKVRSRDHDTDLNDVKRLSAGEGEEPKPENPKPENPKPENPKPENSKPEEQPEQPEQPEQSEQPEPEDSGTTWQNVMNYLTYGKDPTSGWNPENSSGKTKPGRDEAAAYAKQQGWQPIQATQQEFDSDPGHLQDLIKAQQPEFYKAWESGSGRVNGGQQINRGDQGDQVIDSTEIPSDRSLKDIISDMRMKFIKEDWDDGEKLSPKDFLFLLHRAGKFRHNDRDYDAFEDDIDDQSVLNGYAEHIKNYLYTYKPEATQVDSRIDPNEEHIGPMAQDIEQVNPACVKETPEGVKTVDTARLAMMNAGAIADLARQMQALTDRLKALGA